PLKCDVTLEDAALMYLAARILFPSSVRETPDRIKASVIPEELGINPEHITPDLFYRMLDKFTVEIQEEIIKRVNREILNRFKWDFLQIQGNYRNEIARALGEELKEALLADIDTTIVHFEGKKCNLVKHCYNAANPSQIHGVKLVLAQMRSIKLPLFFPVVEGNQADVKQFRPTVLELEKLYPGEKFIFTLDRVMFDGEDLKYAAAKRHIVIIGGKLTKRVKEMWPKEEEFRLVKSELVPSGTTLKKYNVYATRKKVYFEEYQGELEAHFFYDEARAERERAENQVKASAMAQLRSKIEAMLLSEKGRKKLTKKLLRQIEVELGPLARQYKIDLKLVVEKVKNGEAIEEVGEDKWCGRFLIYSTTPKLKSSTVLEYYRGHAVVEEGVKTLKQTLEIRPVYLWNADRVRAYIFLVGMAYLFLSVILFCLPQEERRVDPSRFAERRLNFTGEIIRDKQGKKFVSEHVDDLNHLLNQIDQKFKNSL
ncbi:MAG: transposase, partial [Candidatus Freyarchaeota archaeon]|nr:transposase [Candidatus Jordarchaeia archaeon]